MNPCIHQSMVYTRVFLRVVLHVGGQFMECIGWVSVRFGATAADGLLFSAPHNSGIVQAEVKSEQNTAHQKFTRPWGCSGRCPQWRVAARVGDAVAAQQVKVPIAVADSNSSVL